LRQQHGFSLVEALVAVFVLLLMAAMAFPFFRPYLAEAHVLGAGRQFKTQFRLAASAAVRSGRYTAIRFEEDGARVVYSVYQDGNDNGVRSGDIASGRDVRIAGPFELTGGAPSVRVGIRDGVPALPPDTGLITGDPIRFGRSRMVSFSPLGTATPGTFYLAGQHAQAAVRVNAGTARVRLMVWRGGKWIER
jgi:prepilin-type N-terminal cleavage/methylation domain-containing protein